MSHRFKDIDEIAAEMERREPNLPTDLRELANHYRGSDDRMAAVFEVLLHLVLRVRELESIDLGIVDDD